MSNRFQGGRLGLQRFWLSVVDMTALIKEGPCGFTLITNRFQSEAKQFGFMLRALAARRGVDKES